MFFRQKHHANAILAKRGQSHADLGHVFTEQGVWNLNQDTRAVAHQGVRTDRAAVVEVFQNLECLPHDRMAFLAFDVCHKTNTTGVVFVGGVVQTLMLQINFVGSRSHGALLKFLGKWSIPESTIRTKEINWGQNLINFLLKFHRFN